MIEEVLWISGFVPATIRGDYYRFYASMVIFIFNIAFFLCRTGFKESKSWFFIPAAQVLSWRLGSGLLAMLARRWTSPLKLLNADLTTQIGLGESIYNLYCPVIAKLLTYIPQTRQLLKSRDFLICFSTH